ncbi:MAG TPA: nitroreductase family protein [Pyrinomonadaceae bacterium]|nr:nitroreductase family protein [Pyrinomonadaceae bacterium]
MSSPKFIPLTGYQEYPSDEMKQRAVSFYEEMQRRRTVRQFSNRPVSRDVIEQCIRAAATAPSGANLQPWHFVVITDQSVKRQIRLAAEEEEKEFYTRRAPKEWLEALAPLGTDEHKEFLEIAPYLIAVFVERYGELPTGAPVKHYYPKESVGIACGVLITAIQQVGLASLTHTPSPMKFLNKILGRPGNESPFLLLVVGYPASDAIVPNIKRKRLEDVCTFV